MSYTTDIDASFKANTTITQNKHGWNIDCNKGLWGVSCKSKKACMTEARHYFVQYFLDGEYRTLQKEATIDKHEWYSSSIIGVDTDSRHQRIQFKVRESGREIHFFFDEKDSRAISNYFKGHETKKIGYILNRVEYRK